MLYAWLVALAAAVAYPAAAVARPAFDACFDHHAARMGLDGDLLRDIAMVESGMRPSAINGGHEARTGSRDLGLMQINSRWLPTLARYGISQADLHDPCTSIEVGAWILADLVKKNGNTWDAVGAYNAACTQLKGEDCVRARARYARKVWQARQQRLARYETPTTAAPPGAPVKADAPLAPGLLSSMWANSPTATEALQ